MTAPVNTYSSDVNLNLGQVPEVNDPMLYGYLLDLHAALSSLATYTDNSSEDLIAFLTKFRSVTEVNADYLVDLQDGLILVYADSGDVQLTLPESNTGKGYRYTVKVVAWQAPYSVTVIGSNGELIDSRPAGIKISNNSSYTFMSKATNDTPTVLGYAII